LDERVSGRLEFLARAASQQLRGDTLRRSDLSPSHLRLELRRTLLSSGQPLGDLLSLRLLRFLELRELRGLRLQLLAVRELRALPSDPGLHDLVERLLRRDRLERLTLLVGFFRALSGGRLLRHGASLIRLGAVAHDRGNRPRAATEETVEVEPRPAGKALVLEPEPFTHKARQVARVDRQLRELPEEVAATHPRILGLHLALPPLELAPRPLGRVRVLIHVRRRREPIAR